MILKAFNKGLDKYGYSDTLTWDIDNFYGHQKGIAIGELRAISGEKATVDDIIYNHLPSEADDRDEKLIEIINDPDIVKVTTNLARPDEDTGAISTSEMFYLPYAVEGHSVYEPSINFYNISDEDSEDIFHMTIELCLVVDNLNRYVTIKTVNQKSFLINASVALGKLSILTYQKYEDISKEDILELESYGVRHKYEDNGKGYGFYMDFYDEAGNSYPIDLSLTKNNANKACVSMRLVELFIETRGED